MEDVFALYFPPGFFDKGAPFCYNGPALYRRYRSGPDGREGKPLYPIVRYQKRT